jgi:short-subunit dehydrogenase
MHVAITGASSGIGEALARAFFERGDAVTLIARRADRLSALAREGKSHVAAADLSDVEHAADWIDGAEAALGPIDVLVNNAGASMVHPTVATDWEQAEALIRLNVLAPFKLTCALAPKMLARGSGCIVDIASLAALAPQPGFFFYNASKAALAAASESLRAELRADGVHVLTVYPGPVSTPMGDANFAAFSPWVARVAPTGSTRVLARLVIRAVERRHARLIYPRIYGLARWFPSLARWTADRIPPPERPRGQLRF